MAIPFIYIYILKKLKFIKQKIKQNTHIIVHLYIYAKIENLTNKLDFISIMLRIVNNLSFKILYCTFKNVKFQHSNTKYSKQSNIWHFKNCNASSIIPFKCCKSRSGIVWVCACLMQNLPFFVVVVNYEKTLTFAHNAWLESCKKLENSQNFSKQRWNIHWKQKKKKKKFQKFSKCFKHFFKTKFPFRTKIPKPQKFQTMPDMRFSKSLSLPLPKLLNLI